MFKHDLVELEDLKIKNVDGKRLYITPNGNYPSVTTVTSLLVKEGIAKWRKRVGEEVANKITSTASRRGTNVHKAFEKYLLNEEIPTLAPSNQFLFDDLAPILAERIGLIRGVEAPLYSDYLRVGGRVDAVCEWDGVLSIVDFKTASKRKYESYITNYYLQSSAYAVMFEERTQIPVSQIVIAIAVENDEPQIFVKKRDEYIESFQELREQFDGYNPLPLLAK
jgi:genome maintenance exonuclease 1